MIPTTINDRYRIDAEVGRGGMGAVYRGFDLLLKRDVAVKVLHSTGLGSSGRARLLNEAQATARLSHPNIVAVYDAGESDGWQLPTDPEPGRDGASGRKPFIVMQYVEGRALNELGPQPLERTLEIAGQLCAALAHAHAAGVVHRDLKPENVLVSPDGIARLMDFGLARSGASRLSVEGEIVGTVFYMAPELALGRAYDGRSDLYSLGVMLYEMLAGRLPFLAGDPVAVISQHIYAPVVPPSTYNPAIPAGLEALVLRLMSKEPAGRPASAEEVAVLLARPEITAGDLAISTPAQPLISPLERIARGRMIGRLPELQTVQRLWRAAAAGAGQVLLVSGEPGIGKTRLMRELAAMAEVARGRVLVGICYAEGGAPYGPVVQIVRAALARIDPAELPAAVVAGLQPLAQELERLGQTLPVVSAPIGFGLPADDPRSEQAGLFDSLTALFNSLSRQAPVVIVLEDAHWADSGTLALVRRLARQVAGLPLLLALTYREVELGESKALADLLYDLSRERISTRLKLTRLSREETGELLGVMFGEGVDGAPGVRPEFLDLIYHETEGNPFFIEEVCKALIDEGQITHVAGKWQAAALSEIHVPQSVRMAIQARVGRLPQEAQDLLRLAAVFGREFEFEPLAAVSGQDEDMLIDCLDAAVRAQLIVESQPHPNRARLGSQMPLSLRLVRPTFAFTHALIPAALLDDLSVMRRQRLHRSAGMALEKLYPDRLEALAPQLSRHFSEAGEHEKAVKYLVMAGDRARQVFAFPEAIEAYRQVVEYLRDSERFEKAARILMKLGLVYHQSYDFVRAQEAYDEAFSLWQRAAVTPGADDGPAAAPHPLRTIWNNPGTLDPTRSGEQGSSEIIVLLFDGLVELTADLGVRPCVARQWEIQDGGRRYVFHLRRDYRWSDGAPVTAHDFEFSWKRTLDPITGHANASIFFGVRGARDHRLGVSSDAASLGIRAQDDWTLVVDLEEPAGYFLHLLAASPALPVPRHAVQALGDDWQLPEHLLTNGAFQLEDWQADQRLTLRRNPDYPGAFPGNLQQVQLNLSGSPAERIEAYTRGELDVVSVPPTVSERLQSQFAGESLLFPTLNTRYLGFNSASPPLNDSRVRRALVMALDRELLAGSVFKGRFALAGGGFVPPGLPGHSPGIALPYSPNDARRLLAEAGYPGGAGMPELELRGVTDPDEQRSLAFIQARWRETLGIRTRLEVWSKVDGIFESTGVWSLGWVADYPDADNFLRVAVESVNGILVDDPEYHRLVEAARRSGDQAERVRLYQAADRILIDKAYLAPITYGRTHLLIKPWVKNYRPLPLRTLNLKELIIEEH